MKRIFILASQSMFSQGVVCLLQQEVSFDIVGQQTSLHLALPAIQQLRPDVVILDMHSHFDQPNAGLLQILMLLPAITVIGLSLRDNTFQVYRAKQKEANSMADLVNVISDEV